jgi:hypothetical protein
MPPSIARLQVNFARAIEMPHPLLLHHCRWLHTWIEPHAYCYTNTASVASVEKSVETLSHALETTRAEHKNAIENLGSIPLLFPLSACCVHPKSLRVRPSLTHGYLARSCWLKVSSPFSYVLACPLCVANLQDSLSCGSRLL